MEDALTSMIGESAKSRQEVMKNMNQEKTVEEVFFETCILRMKKLPSTTKSFVQLQISQLFINAENPHLPQIPITPLPTNMAQINSYCRPSASQGGNNARNAFFSNNEPLRRNTQSWFGINSTDNESLVDTSIQDSASAQLKAWHTHRDVVSLVTLCHRLLI